MRTRLGTVVRSAGSFGVVVGVGLTLVACGGEVMVGEAEVMTTEALAKQCADNSAQLRDPRARWLATPNDFGDLAGSRWAGSMKGLPTLVLEFRADQTGSLVVGTAAPSPTDRDDGYLVMAEPSATSQCALRCLVCAATAGGRQQRRAV